MGAGRAARVARGPSSSSVPRHRGYGSTSAPSSGPASTASPPSQQQPQPGARPGQMGAVRQALLLFVHSKLTMCPDHRFSFARQPDRLHALKVLGIL
ncbi:hypothetical protein PVAP13_2NG119206 [Panicum virgatum]|uniref:Uncharacterized protein n=1 Tax=Panicum virgatum TaxID=38727 RepID=A0A8T0VLL7_PANVG|nr:hypothetical protein PVAP13_2NG119206 [Panicum virgatum]